MRCSWLFLSTKIPHLDTADDTRILKCGLIPAIKRFNARDQFDELQRDVSKVLTPEYCNGLLARMISVIPFFDDVVNIFCTVLGELLPTRRDVDNYAPVFSALWFLQNDTIPDEFDASIFIQGYDFSKVGADTQTEEEKCINTIMQIIPHSWDKNIGSAMIEASMNKELLASIGIGFSKDFNQFYIESNNAMLRSLLKDTAYYDSYSADLLMVNGATKGVQRIGGRSCRCVIVPSESFVEVQEEKTCLF
jgi:hypothetical protein